MIGRHRHTARRALLALAVLALLVPASASAESTNRWQNPCGTEVYQAPHICTVITNDALKFSSTPGHFVESSLLRGSATATKGEVTASSANDIAYFITPVWSLFTSPSGFHHVENLLGRVNIAIRSSTLTPYTVNVIANGERIATKPGTEADSAVTSTTKLGLSCDNEGYLACITPGVWVNNRKWNFFGDHVVPDRITGFAAIETRPLVVKVINMTEQPLVPEGEVRVDNMKRSSSIHSPTQIAGLSDVGRPGVGYYHLYRDSTLDGSATLTFRFADGPAGQTTLTRQELSATVRVDKDGATDASLCKEPTGLLISVECSINPLGAADGTLEAVVIVQTN